ncbi:MAG: hypothetical protein JWO83_3063 [Caulobacteraceae bacterium]|jgi:hypothetical protein|nr:hypothetical protein [Caulobacteraceae bacterium]
MADVDDDADSQDLAEVFDETNTTRDGYDIADPDMAPDVFDVTSAEDDDDDDEEDPDDFDPDQVDEAEREEMLEEDDGIDSPRVLPLDEADLVQASVAGIADGDLTADERPSEDPWEGASGGESPADETAAHDDLDARLDEALKETFPASDPLALLRAD